MKIFDLEKQAIRPRVLLLDFEKTDAQLLKDLGYKVHLGSSGFNSGTFSIPIDLHRIDILIYRMSYTRQLPKPGQEITLYSITKGITHIYRIGEKESGKVHYKFPLISPYSKGDYWNMELLRDNILKKGGSVIVFLGSNRIDEDEKLMKDLFAISNSPVTIKGDSNNEYDLDFVCNGKLYDIRGYCKNLITGKTGYKVECLRGIKYPELNGTDGSFQKDEFAALDENGTVYAYCKHRKDYKGNLIFLPDYGPGNINIVKDLFALLPALSPNSLFSVNYQQGAWLDSEPYKFTDEIAIISKEEAIKLETEEKLKKLEENRKEVRSETDYFRAILVNGDDDKVDEEEQLKPPLKKVLEWLGIKVTDLDEILRKKEVALMNDFILEVDGKEIICEAKGVTTGTKIEYVTQVHRHILRYSKLTDKPALPGMLILSYQRDKAPNERSDFYSDIAAQKQAEEDDMGLLDTRELFDICRKIYKHTREKELKEEARRLIVKSGIIRAKDMKV